MWLSITIKILTKALSLFITLLLMYSLISLILMRLPVNTRKPDNGTIPIYIMTNGVHLDVVLPYKHLLKDWSGELSSNEQKANKVNFVSFGWGDENFYRYVEDWSDLTFGVAFNAVFLRSSSAMHVMFYNSLTEGEYTRKILVDSTQYNTITNFIEHSFQKENNAFVPISDINYYGYDQFFKANGSYNLFFTCNSWTNKCLKQADIKTSVWSPLDKGPLWHHKNN